MSDGNGSNGNGSHPITTPAPTVAESLAQLKDAVGRLWKRVDAAELKATQEYQQISEKLDAWIQTNVLIQESTQELIRIIGSNTQESKRSIESYEKGSRLLEALSNQLVKFEQLTIELKAALPQLTATSNLPSPPVTEALSDQFSAMRSAIEQLKQAFNKTSNPSPILSNNPYTRIEWSIDNQKQTLDAIEANLSQIRDRLSSPTSENQNPASRGGGAIRGLIDSISRPALATAVDADGQIEPSLTEINFRRWLVGSFFLILGLMSFFQMVSLFRLETLQRRNYEVQNSILRRIERIENQR